MSKITVKYFRNKGIIIKHKNKRNSLRVEKVEPEVILHVLEPDLTIDKEYKKIPHIIAEDKAVKLWKFFRSFIDGEMKLLAEPRYMIRVGNDWFKIKEMSVI